MGLQHDKEPQRFLGIWAMVLVALLAASLFGNVALARYVQQARDNDPDIYLDEAEKLMNAGETNTAWLRINAALEKNPRYPRSYKVKGDLFFRQERWAQALEAYEEALALRSREQGVVTNALWAHIELRRFDDAIAFGRARMAEGYNSAQVARYLAEAYNRAGRIGEAIPYLRTALRTYADDLYLLSLLRQAYLSTGQEDLARAMQDRIAELQRGIAALTEPDEAD